MGYACFLFSYYAVYRNYIALRCDLKLEKKKKSFPRAHIYTAFSAEFGSRKRFEILSTEIASPRAFDIRTYNFRLLTKCLRVTKFSIKSHRRRWITKYRQQKTELVLQKCALLRRNFLRHDAELADFHFADQSSA